MNISSKLWYFRGSLNFFGALDARVMCVRGVQHPTTVRLGLQRLLAHGADVAAAHAEAPHGHGRSHRVTRAEWKRHTAKLHNRAL